MSRRTTTALTFGLVLSVHAIGLAAKPPPKPKPTNTQLTAAASPIPINFGGSTALSGKLAGGQAGGQPIVIEASPAPFTAYTQVASATTAANGTYGVTVKPTMATRYRVTAKTSPPTVSGVVQVGVRIRVGTILSDSTPRSGTNVAFSGRAYPAHDGALVSIQKRTSTGSFTTVARARLLDDGATRSRYARSVRISRSGVYRVRVASNDGDHLAGIGRSRAITAH